MKKLETRNTFIGNTMIVCKARLEGDKVTKIELEKKMLVTLHEDDED